MSGIPSCKDEDHLNAEKGVIQLVSVVSCELFPQLSSESWSKSRVDHGRHVWAAVHGSLWPYVSHVPWIHRKSMNMIRNSTQCHMLIHTKNSSTQIPTLNAMSLFLCTSVVGKLWLELIERLAITQLGELENDRINVVSTSK